jgi:hypothetical protein
MRSLIKCPICDNLPVLFTHKKKNQSIAVCPSCVFESDDLLVRPLFEVSCEGLAMVEREQMCISLWNDLVLTFMGKMLESEKCLNHER